MENKAKSSLNGVIFDFDGVIVESVEVKCEAFRRLFLEFPDHLDDIMTYHMANGGISRFKKFKYIYDEILHKDLSEEKSQELGRQFTQFAYRGVIEASFVKGAPEFLKKYHKKIPLFIISGTPEEELMQILNERNMTHFFKGSFGTPRTKAELCKLILRENALPREKVVFVGDSINDYAGAQEAGLRFIGRVHKNYENPFQELKDITLIRDLSELEKILQKELVL